MGQDVAHMLGSNPARVNNNIILIGVMMLSKDDLLDKVEEISTSNEQAKKVEYLLFSSIEQLFSHNQSIGYTTNIKVATAIASVLDVVTFYQNGKWYFNPKRFLNDKDLYDLKMSIAQAERVALIALEQK